MNGWAAFTMIGAGGGGYAVTASPHGMALLCAQCLPSRRVGLGAGGWLVRATGGGDGAGGW